MEKDPNELFAAIRDADKIEDYLVEQGRLLGTEAERSEKRIENRIVLSQILDKTYRVQYTCPAFSSQLVRVKWHTPKEPREIEIQVSHGGAIKDSIVDLSGKEPLAPDFYDRNPGLEPSRLELPEWSEQQQTMTNWSEWVPVWVPPKGLQPGYWTFERADYKAELKAECELKPEDRVQTAWSTPYE